MKNVPVVGIIVKMWVRMINIQNFVGVVLTTLMEKVKHFVLS